MYMKWKKELIIREEWRKRRWNWKRWRKDEERDKIKKNRNRMLLEMKEGKKISQIWEYINRIKKRRNKYKMRDHRMEKIY